MIYVEKRFLALGVLAALFIVFATTIQAGAVVNTNLPSLPLSQIARSWTDLNSIDENGNGLIDVNAVEQGPGSGFDADTVDGYHASDLLAAASGPAYVNFEENAPYLLDFGGKIERCLSSYKTHAYCFNDVGPITTFTYYNNGLFGYGSPGKSFAAGSNDPSTAPTFTAHCIVKVGGDLNCVGFDDGNVQYQALYVGRVIAHFYRKAEYNVEYNIQLTVSSTILSDTLAYPEFTANILEFCGDTAPEKISAIPVDVAVPGVYVGRLEVNRQYYTGAPPTNVFSVYGTATYATRCDSGYLVIAAFFAKNSATPEYVHLLDDVSYVKGRIVNVVQ